MSGVMSKRLKSNIGKRAKVFLKNGFRYSGQILNSDEEWLEVLDGITGHIKLIRIEDISDIEFYGVENNEN